MKSKMKQPEEELQEEKKEADTVERATENDELEALKRQNEELRKELDERKNLGERLENEIAEFSEMFPDVSLSEIPEEIWSEVKRGLPLSASYARHEKRRALSEKHAFEVNQASREASSGSVRGFEDNYFTAEEVRKMSASEVKKNYSKIISSMKHWN